MKWPRIGWYSLWGNTSLVPQHSFTRLPWIDPAPWEKQIQVLNRWPRCPVWRLIPSSVDQQVFKTQDFYLEVKTDQKKKIKATNSMCVWSYPVWCFSTCWAGQAFFLNLRNGLGQLQSSGAHLLISESCAGECSQQKYCCSGRLYRHSFADNICPHGISLD